MTNEILAYYSSTDEKDRLAADFSLERIRTQEIILRYLPPTPVNLIDIGGAAGVYSFWLADQGHQVTLVDLTPKHIEQARQVNQTAWRRLAGIQEGNACNLQFAPGTFDVALLLGPVYHLLDRPLRVKALHEALRVLKPGGLLFVAAISRFASLFDGFKRGLVADERFQSILDHDLKTGDHHNSTDNPGYFTSAHFHLVPELRDEIADAGASVLSLLAVEGAANCIPDVEERLKDTGYRAYLLEKLRQTETEPSLLGASSHLIAVIEKPRTEPK